MAINLQSAVKGKVVTTKVIQIQVLDEDGKTKTYNFENPKENLTLDQVRETFATAINGRWLLSNSSNPIISVKSANYSTAVKTYLDGAEATISPSVVNITDINKLDQRVFVTGATIESTAISDITGTIDGESTTKEDWFFTYTVSGDTIFITLNMNSSPSTGSKYIGYANLYISAAGMTTTIPININIQV